ncbi:SusC/RagA family TonB-linked outer membrane protein [Chitinophaga sp. ysch24]|uniref:SusC/RagA family TonB-linked outer membrane protein n=2 Tax=Chitinophaga tropicalis TaxID=2683588 RepID=A0A7K1U2S9_9BACT|nr:SusC/RagA family TonB-linked outer membrane protein [Chitinophaga tropicalis]
MYLTALCKNKEQGSALLTKIKRVMKLSFILILAGTLHVCASVHAQNVTLHGKSITLEKAFSEIRKQTGYNFFYTAEDLDKAGKVDASISSLPLNDAMTTLLKGKALSFSIVDGVIIIKRKEITNTPLPPADITGKVVNEKGEPIPGATVMIEGTKIGTLTNSAGVFTLHMDNKEGTLVITAIGFKRQAMKVKGEDAIQIVLQQEPTKLNDVVISTGMFNRRKESFTGAVSTFTAEQIKTVSNQNVVKALAILDPSFQVVENLDIGSNPNRLPDIQLRGQTGFPDIRGVYTTNPNLPLFILDGFETTLEKVTDLNMNLVQSITILKDASAKAIYGSRAGNGVVVIETKPPTAGKMRLSYNGSMDITAPDLSSYKLTNSMQKIDAEVLSGKYTSADPATQASLLREYSTNLQAALEGVNTYWLSQPLRNGIGQRHAINLDGGDDVLRYSVNLNYNNIAGVMKGSDRNTISGVINLIYRKNNFQFRNNLTIDRNRSNNSPYGSFANVARLNPYWRMKDANGNYVKTFNNGAIGNPMYDGTLNSKDFTTYTNIIENFYTDWDAARNLRLTARVGINAQKNDLQQFTPANHSSYANVLPGSDAYLDRGEYTIQNGKISNLNADLLANYSFQLSKHHFYVNGAYSVTQNISTTNGMTMVGFPNDKMDDISFGYRYKPGTKAVGTENTSRTIALTSALNYSYDDRLLADLSYRGNASSQFGADNRWGLFWSAGLGWNLHREQFMRSLSFINLFKLRASVGTTGTQNFNSYQSLASYNYITDRTYNGDMGLDLIALPNPRLQWQQVQDNNIGVDLTVFNRLSIRFDYYIRDTKNLLSDMIIAPSNGFDTYKENIGESRNKGFQLAASLRVYERPESRTNVNVFVNVARNTNRIRKVSNSLIQLNKDADDDKGDVTTGNSDSRRPATRFEPGQSMTAIWVVPSLGIDPANGREIYVKKDGSLTYDWSAADYVVDGDSNPEYNGTFGANVQHRGLSANFAFTFRYGGQQYNTTLVNRVENADFNYNVDIRALEQRWRQPGDRTLYKNIADKTDTRPSSRFVQDLHELLFSSVSLGYDFSQSRWFRKVNMNRIYLAMNLNDLARISSVKTERGLDYPFARTISTSLSITF